jgi:4-amino-4-deoxy-L-arabinose transferase-like glycosyltransferase
LTNVPHSPDNSPSSLRPARSAFLVALFVRLAALGISQQHADPVHHHFLSQGLEALLLAQSLADGHGYAFRIGEFVPTAWLAPVYVWFLTLGKLLFPANGKMVTLFGQLINILFSALTCYPIFALGKRVAGKTIGVVSAWTWALLPVAILMPIAFVWDQSLASFLLASLFAFSYRTGESSSIGLWCAYGALWGIAALTNPSLFVLFPCFGLWFWLRRKRAGLPVLRPVSFAVLACVLVLLPWTVRNWIELGGFTFVKSNFGVELWLGNNPQVKDVWTPLRNPHSNEAELDRLIAEGELKYNREKLREAISFIAAHPGDSAQHILKRILDTWTAYYDAREDFYIVPLGIYDYYVVFCAFFALAVLAGSCAGMLGDWLEWFPLLCAALVFPLPYYLTHTSERYRHPIDPMLTVLAVYGVLRVWEMFQARVPAKVAA